MATLTRKQFLCVLVTIGAAACGDDEAGSSSGGGSEGGGGNAGGGGNGGNAGGSAPGCDGGASGTVGDPAHTTLHTIMNISAQDVADGVDATYTLEMGGGGNMHAHDITVTATDFAMLQQGMPVTVTSTPFGGGGGGGMHTHDVTLTCV